jgi:hypothetical protein
MIKAIIAILKKQVNADDVMRLANKTHHLKRYSSRAKIMEAVNERPV